MAKKWGPDTCACVIERIPGPIATWVATETTCPEHVGLVGQDLLETCLRESRRRTAVRWLAEMLYGLTEQQTRPLSFDPSDPEATTSHFDADRNLVVIYKTRDGRNLLSPQERRELQDAMDIQSGEGLTIVA